VIISGATIAAGIVAATAEFQNSCSLETGANVLGKEAVVE
tara:strand:+ start:471 stop:590 length:120 start_codon:yes stop_codon:yes gene_type:complete